MTLEVSGAWHVADSSGVRFMLNSNDDEKEVLRRLKAGELDALNILMNKYKDELYKLSFRILGNKEDAEEVLQDTFLKAFRNIKSFEAKSKLST